MLLKNHDCGCIALHPLTIVFMRVEGFPDILFWLDAMID